MRYMYLQAVELMVYCQTYMYVLYQLAQRQSFSYRKLAFGL